MINATWKITALCKGMEGNFKKRSQSKSHWVYAIWAKIFKLCEKSWNAENLRVEFLMQIDTTL